MPRATITPIRVIIRHAAFSHEFIFNPPTNAKLSELEWFIVLRKIKDVFAPDERDDDSRAHATLGG